MTAPADSGGLGYLSYASSSASLNLAGFPGCTVLTVTSAFPSTSGRHLAFTMAAVSLGPKQAVVGPARCAAGPVGPIMGSAGPAVAWSRVEGHAVAHTFSTVDEYIASFPPDVAVVLQGVREAIHRAVPGAGERIGYGMAIVTLDDSYLVGFAGWKSHIGLYPAPTGDAAFEERIAPYRAARATARFPLRAGIPLDLIEEMAALLAAPRMTA